MKKGCTHEAYYRGALLTKVTAFQLLLGTMKVP